MFALSVGALVISLNPDVKWNEYNDEAYGLKSYYFNTIWSSLDGFTYAASHGKYLLPSWSPIFLKLSICRYFPWLAAYVNPSKLDHIVLK
jgi:hypothetical protein